MNPTFDVIHLKWLFFADNVFNPCCRLLMIIGVDWIVDDASSLYNGDINAFKKLVLRIFSKKFILQVFSALQVHNVDIRKRMEEMGDSCHD